MAAPTVTHAAWGQLHSLTGTIRKFAIALRWSPVSGATSYSVIIDINQPLGEVDGFNTTGLNYWGHFSVFPSVNNHSAIVIVVGGPSGGLQTIIDLTPTEVAGPSTISGTVGSFVFAKFSIGPTPPASWSWAIVGAPTGVVITDKGTPLEESDGGLVSGIPASEGVFNAAVAITNFTSDVEIFNTQQFPVTFHISGERYIEDFHTDTSRTAINIRHPNGTVASWNFNGANELELTLGETRALHAILRVGTGYLDAGVTKLSFVAKLPQRPNSPPVLTATAATPAVETFGSVKAWPLALTADSAFARRVMEAADIPALASADAVSQLLDAQISYTHGGKIHRSAVFKIRLNQPISQL